ncbi:DUF4202 domain-containing protein [Aquimarina intermedia]|uniref:Uncharacterized protein DUF4202 n=1 Tax=Aquimarina intermedia TaxID=350814 RepID=A0A5S5C192_9FLAO|nr:DUF4202 domain-containing protein [Aquimarina intermedia]TYP72206.1 uncharacterized protein DUF4202 [Aquimarina intermedia]
MKQTSKIKLAYQHIDRENAEDPNKETINDLPVAKELVYGQRMTEALMQYFPEASEALKLAARAQHICRWQIPRDRFPMDRTGYLQWRTDLKKFHADKASSILYQLGYDKEVIERVSFLIQKKKLKRDEETQCLEDTICLVFLQYYFEDFLTKHTDDKIISILQKTWAKMSPRGQREALALDLSNKAQALIKQALNA